MTALMRRISYHYVRGDEDFTKIESYLMCGFELQIGVNPLSKLGFGTVIWDAALALCQYFEKEGLGFSHKKVIELGAGTGIVGILSVLLGGDVTITDKPELLKQIQRNVSVNVPSSCRPRVKVRALSWGYDHTFFPSDYDFILGTDILYYDTNVPLILKTLQHLSNEKTIIYFASTMLFNKKSAYQTLSQDFDPVLVCKYEDKDVNVYKMTKKRLIDRDHIVW